VAKNVALLETTMEHKGGNTDNGLAAFFTTEEIELSKVLLQLAYPVSYSDYRRNVLNVNWGRTRKRIIQPSEPIIGASAAPVCCWPLPPRGTHASEKPKISKQRQRRREDWQEMINERMEVLKREVGKVGKVGAYYHEKLKAINSELKARKQERSSCMVQ
jgi:hypothetical protein